jgi:hypothetical protein
VDVERGISEIIKVWLAGGGVALIALWHFLPRRAAVGALLTLTLVAAVNYAQWGPKLMAKKIDSYDVIHYYMGAKYFGELGYYDLYPALILADKEHPDGRYHKKLFQYRAQTREEGYLGRRPIREAVERGETVRDEQFTPERWDSFKQDFYHLQRDYNMSPGYWRRMMDDRGFNGTPVWILLARPIANAVPAKYIKPLCYLDLAWLLLALLVIRWAYDDWVPVLWCLFFLCVTYSLRWPTPGGVFLRYDWIAMMLIAMGLLRKGKPFLAGIFAGLPGLLRFFPVLWMYGPGIKGLLGIFKKPETADLAREGEGAGDPSETQGGEKKDAEAPKIWARFDRKLLRMAGGFLLVFAVLEGGAVISFGTEPIKTHMENIREHTKPEELSSRRIGHAIGYTFDGNLLPTNIAEDQKQRVIDSKTERMVITVALLIALGFGMRNLRNDEVFAFGYIPFFMLATASYYYAVARITLILLHAHDMSKWRNRVGLAFLLALEVFCNYSETVHAKHRVYLVGNLSQGLAWYALLMTVWLLVEEYQRWRKSKDGSAGKPLAKPPTAA